MANWNLPTTTDTYTNFLQYLKDRDLDNAKQFDGVTLTNPVAGMIRWNSTSKFWEKYSGSAWADLTTKYMIDVDKVDGCTVDDAAAASTTVLWTSNKINTFAGNYYTKTEIDTIRADYILKNGNTGTLTIGTNDASAFNLETNNASRLSIGSSGNVTVSTPASGVALTVGNTSDQNSITATGTIQATVLRSTIATGTAPFTVTSTTKVTNLNADLLGDMTTASANTVSTIVARDASGNFSAGTITGTLTGNASTATTLQTARTINGEPFNGSTNINIEERLGTAIASATTTTIGTKGLGDTIHITGVATITSLGVSNTGTRRALVFDNALTLAHNATSLILPGGVSITTVAGDSAEMVCENGVSGYWRCVRYTPSIISNTELSYLDGVTSNIQTQIGTKAPTAGPTFTGTVTLPSTTSIGTVTNVEIGYLDGVTSAIQTQITAAATTANGKIAATNYASADGTVGGTVKARINGATLYLTTNGNNA